jgi:hypothetical protein
MDICHGHHFDESRITMSRGTLKFKFDIKIISISIPGRRHAFEYDSSLHHKSSKTMEKQGSDSNAVDGGEKSNVSNMENPRELTIPDPPRPCESLRQIFNHIFLTKFWD